MIAPDRKGVAIPAKDEDVQIRPAQGNPTGKGQRPAMNVMSAVRLHKVGKPARAADSGHSGDLLVPKFALFDQFEIERQDGKIAAARTPSGMVCGDFFFG